MSQVVREVIGVGLVLGASALPVAAQSMSLPAADPVGIARSGAQVAYGYSLEAATANPALLASLKEKTGVYVSLGLEMMSVQESLESNQVTQFSADRNKTIPAFGLAARVSPYLTLGLKLDDPYLRHAQFPDDAASRFFGDSVDLSARRLEAQAAWVFSPNVSAGIGLGLARLSYGSSSVMRLNVPNDPSSPVSASNAVNGLVEQRVGESGDKVVPSYSLGLRWAINPRWTMGFTYQSGLKGDLSLNPGFRDPYIGLYANDGLSSAPVGADTRAVTLLAKSQPQAGTGTLELPSQTTFGVRHRIMPWMTWEADVKWTSAGLRVPSFATIQTLSETVSAPTDLPHGKSHLTLSGSTEMDLGKFWTLRMGFSLDQRSVDVSTAEPLLGGAPTAAFSAGAGYKLWGGELNFGYQYRQSQDTDTNRLNGAWSSAGYRPVGTRLRMEGMGHLLALGYRILF